MPSLHARKLADVAAVIRAARVDRGLTQAELAEQLSFPRDYMLDVEAARPNLYTTRLFRTLHKLGITITLTYGEDDAEA